MSNTTLSHNGMLDTWLLKIDWWLILSWYIQSIKHLLSTLTIKAPSDSAICLFLKSRLFFLPAGLSILYTASFWVNLMCHVGLVIEAELSVALLVVCTCHETIKCIPYRNVHRFYFCQQWTWHYDMAFQIGSTEVNSAAVWVSNDLPVSDKYS